MIVAIDPGTTESAICFYRPEAEIQAFKILNEDIRHEVKRCENNQINKIYIEMIASYGMPVGKEVFETCVWIGRFVEHAHILGISTHFVYRKEVKLHICGSTRATDANIRTELINRFGDPGTKKNPGRLYGFKGDMWAALAVAVTAHETLCQKIQSK